MDPSPFVSTNLKWHLISRITGGLLPLPSASALQSRPGRRAYWRLLSHSVRLGNALTGLTCCTRPRRTHSLWPSHWPQMRAKVSCQCAAAGHRPIAHTRPALPTSCLNLFFWMALSMNTGTLRTYHCGHTAVFCNSMGVPHAAPTHHCRKLFHITSLFRSFRFTTTALSSSHRVWRTLGGGGRSGFLGETGLVMRRWRERNRLARERMKERLFHGQCFLKRWGHWQNWHDRRLCCRVSQRNRDMQVHINLCTT